MTAMDRYAFLFLSMSLSEAKEVLGFPPTASPTSNEVMKAYRALALQHHPDRGGDQDKMVEINVAKDLLTGQRSPAYERSPEPAPRAQPVTWEKPSKREVSFAEAKSKAGIPSGVEWKFVTDIQKGTGYSSDEYYRSDNCWVAYGRTDTKHVFVGMHHFEYSTYFAGSGADQDLWDMKAVEFPVKGDEGTTPAWLYGNVVKMLKAVDFKGRFNSKVVDAKDWNFTEKFPRGSGTSIKNWLADTGEVKKDDPRVQGRKQVIEIQYHEAYREKKPGFVETKYGGKFEQIVILINGKAYPLKEEDIKKITHSSKVMKAIFGDYAYDGSKKQLTRLKNAEALLKIFLEGLDHLPKEVEEAFQQALAQKQQKK